MKMRSKFYFPCFSGFDSSTPRDGVGAPSGSKQLALVKQNAVEHQRGCEQEGRDGSGCAEARERTRRRNASRVALAESRKFERNSVMKLKKKNKTKFKELRI